VPHVDHKQPKVLTAVGPQFRNSSIVPLARSLMGLLSRVLPARGPANVLDNSHHLRLRPDLSLVFREVWPYTSVATTTLDARQKFLRHSVRVPLSSLFLPPPKLSNESRQILSEELPWAEIWTPFRCSPCRIARPAGKVRRANPAFGCPELGARRTSSSKFQAFPLPSRNPGGLNHAKRLPGAVIYVHLKWPPFGKKVRLRRSNPQPALGRYIRGHI